MARRAILGAVEVGTDEFDRGADLNDGRYDDFDRTVDLNDGRRGFLNNLKLRSCLRSNPKTYTRGYNPYDPIRALNSNKFALPELMVQKFDNTTTGHCALPLCSSTPRRRPTPTGSKPAAIRLLPLGFNNLRFRSVQLLLCTLHKAVGVFCRQSLNTDFTELL